MNILHVTPYYAPAYAFGGVVRAVEGISRALVARGHNVTVLTTDALTRDQRVTSAQDKMINGVRVVRARNFSLKLRGAANLSTPFAMRQLAPNLIQNADIIHCHEFRTLENLLITPHAARRNKPLLLSPHGTLTLTTGRGGLKSLWDSVLSPSVARRFSGVIGLTDAETQEAKIAWAGFNAPQTQFFTIPNGVNAQEFDHLSGGEAFRAKYGLGAALICLFMGRLHERKGVEVLLQAFQLANIPNSALAIAGVDEGMLTRLKARVSDEDRVIFTGHLDGETRLAALAAADIFALPATGEGLSMATLESLAAGLPVLISPGCNLPEVATHHAGMIAEAQPAPLAEALRVLLTNPDLRAEMGENGRALIRDRFTWDFVAGRLEETYNHVRL